MRHHEYRAWNCHGQRMVGWQDYIAEDSGIVLSQLMREIRPLPANLIYLEYTQATDNAGAKVFEGDIVQDGNGLRFMIEYRKDLYRFILCSLDGRRVVRSSLDAYHNITVIGNVYEAHS